MTDDLVTSGSGNVDRTDPPFPMSLVVLGPPAFVELYICRSMQVDSEICLFMVADSPGKRCGATGGNARLMRTTQLGERST